MKKTILIFLSLTSCTKQQNSINTQDNNKIKNEIPVSISVQMPLFDHPPGWQIISMSNIDLIKPYKDLAKETFGINVRI